MPVVQEYEPQDAPSALIGGRAAMPDDAGADVGAATQTSGNDLATIAYKVNEDQGRLWAYKAASDLRIASQNDLRQKSQNADPSDPNFATFADDIATNFQNQADNVMAAAPSRSATKYLGMHLATLKDNLYQHAAGFQAQTQAEYGTALHDQAVGSNTQALTINPGNDNFEQIRAASEDFVDGIHGLDAAQKLKLKATDLRTYAFAQVTGAALRDSTGFLRDVGLTGAAATPTGPRGGVGTGVPGPAPVSNDPYFEAALQAQGVTGTAASFARAVYQQESASGAANTTGVNSSNVTGPMQVQEATFNGLKDQGLLPANANWRDPNDNKLAGAALIRQLSAAYGGNTAQMAAAYYAGPKAVNADGSINAAMADLKNPGAPNVGQYVAQVTGRMTGATPSGAPPIAMADAEPASEGAIVSSQSSLDGWENLTVGQRIQTVRMAEQNIRAQNAGLGAAASAAARALKASQEKYMNDTFDKIVDPNSAGYDPASMVHDGNPLTFEQRERVVAFQKSFNAGENKTDPSTFNSLFGQIQAGKITSSDQLTPYLGNGIAYNDLTKLRGEIDGKGQPLAAQKAAFLKSAYGQISQSTISNHDPDGEANYYKFLGDFNQQFDAQTKAGVPAADLLDPKSKSSLVPMVGRYTRTLTDQVNDMTTRMSGGPARVLPPTMLRQPGETPAAYWARTGAAKQ